MIARPSSTKRPYRMAARAEGAAATRQRVLSSAWGQFSERPYEDVRLADIARDADVTVQTIHGTIGSKDDLFVAAWIWAAASAGEHRLHAKVGDVVGAVHLLYDSYEEGGDGFLRVLAQEERIPAVRQMADSGR